MAHLAKDHKGILKALGEQEIHVVSEYHPTGYI